MIEIKLQFHHLEAAIEALTRVRGLNIVQTNGPVEADQVGKPAPAPAAASGQGTAKAGAAPGKTGAAASPAVAAAVSAQQVSTAAPAPAPTPTVPAPAPAATTAAAPASPSEDKPKVTYKDLQAAVLKLYAKDKKATLAIATGMGAADFRSLNESQWAEALAKVNAALGEGA